MPEIVSTSSLEKEGRALVERLGGHWTPNGGMCRCPAHDDRRPSLSVRPGTRRLLFHCFAGCDTAEVLRACASAGIIHPAAAFDMGASPRPDRSERLRASARRLWSEARPIADTPAARYLARRGLRTTSSALRYHPRTPHGPRPLTQYRPALLAAVSDNDGVVAVHRTFLGPRGQGLASLPDPKLGLGRFGTGAVRLHRPNTVLGLAEGLETALSAASLFDVPCWATLGTERFRHVVLPARVSRLLLFLDNDRGGRRAEALARAAFGHIGVIEAHYPPSPGEDWNDVLLGRTVHQAGDGRGEVAGED